MFTLDTSAKTLARKRSSSFYILAFGILFGLVAAYGAVQIINRATSSVPVVVAATDIQPFTRITEAQLKVEMVPRAAVKHGMYPSVKGVVGRVSKTEIPEGWPIWSGALAQNTPGSVLTARISEENNPDLRAVPLKLDHISSLGGRIEPGDRVDVVGAMKLPAGGGSAVQPVCRIIAANVKVLDVIRGEKQTEGVILAMTPQQNQEVQFALSSGTISLALNPYETNVNAANTSPTTSLSFVTKMLSGTPVQNQNDTENKQQGGEK
ncbi:Flp pilus assembly protein CpaB [Desulfofundulus thermocisternus]|uniref:Flp pilus assembly protein CpaB n=1 Tax=Desulfofundulus thermocisternus TaxID=42471 RepID=UPI00217CE394|nr:Flp pilus assembly protein CpaB [Desulfofundulus thermocisternus]MCS5697293.1 Flp pilus assembly protein CpaB [Desulfofundulus thermocisternus]